jgi:hypothetical protein
MLTTARSPFLLILLAFVQKTFNYELQRVTDSDEKILKKPTISL